MPTAGRWGFCPAIVQLRLAYSQEEGVDGSNMVECLIKNWVCIYPIQVGGEHPNL